MVMSQRAIKRLYLMQVGSVPEYQIPIKLLDLVERAHIGLVIFGHDREQWEGLKKLPAYYE